MSDYPLWAIICILGGLTYLTRFSFLGLIGARPLPDWVTRHLRYTGVAVMPGLVAPLVLWPEATGGTPDPARLVAAMVTLGVGIWRKDVLTAIAAGAVTLGVGLAVFG